MINRNKIIQTSHWIAVFFCGVTWLSLVPPLIAYFTAVHFCRMKFLDLVQLFITLSIFRVINCYFFLSSNQYHCSMLFHSFRFAIYQSAKFVNGKNEMRKTKCIFKWSTLKKNCVYADWCIFVIWMILACFVLYEFI